MLRHIPRTAAPAARYCTVTTTEATTTAAAAAEGGKRPNVFRRFGRYVLDYAKRVAEDYKTVATDVVTDSRAQPLRALRIGALVGGIVYALYTNPSEREMRDHLAELRQKMVLVPLANHNSSADDKLEGLTELINTGRLDYYDCWLFSLLVKRPYDRRVNIYASQDKNLKDWPWFAIGRNVVDVGAFGRFFAVEKAFVDFDVHEEEFAGAPDHREQPEYAKWLRSVGISWNN